ncbi:tripartite tricarboxylate transporter TctB family protein [Pelobacter seleniigenes]|uniref:tripartite tricarboxylate transporter TctB family protein n=1 Tax=Pelobacter seleniigenes TaxID=407188 RepID=UPI0004A6E9D9|nr:tripartite tricarboxylate transporter TctB family protein [Pelobacter seleniigenes]
MLMTRMKNVATDTNFWTGIGTILLAVLLYTASFNIQEFIATRVGASFLPRVAAVLFAILGILLIVGSFRCAPTDPIVKEESQEPTETTFGGLPAVLLSAFLMCAYVGLMSRLGFIITSAVYIFFQILVLAKGAKRQYLLFVVISLITPILVYMLFVHVFKVMIPAGILS